MLNFIMYIYLMYILLLDKICPMHLDGIFPFLSSGKIWNGMEWYGMGDNMDQT